jgi:hypothetical protein
MADETPQPTPQGDPSLFQQWLALVKKLLPTNWRAIVAWAVMSLGIAGVNFLRGPADQIDIPPPPTPIWPDGWVPPDERDTKDVLALEGVWKFDDTPAHDLAGGEDDDAPLWRLYAALHGKSYPAVDQGQIGSCVGQGFAGAIAHSLAAQAILKRGPPQRKAALVVSEMIYAGSRVEVNGGRVPFFGDGSTGAWAVKWLSTGGILERGIHGQHDLSAYSVERCRVWGERGVPDELEPEAKKNLCQYALITNATDARKALQQGYAISVCSNQGFNNIRDSDGFLKAQGTWNHCMFVAGYRGGSRKGFLVVNSWGDKWVNGPKGKWDDIPAGSFWADWDVMDRMLKQGDSFGISGVGGFKKQRIDPADWIVKRAAFVQPVLAIWPK